TTFILCIVILAPSSVLLPYTTLFRSSDEEIRDFLVARYGDYVLFRPPVRSDTWILWFGPALVLLAGVAGIAIAVVRRRRNPQGAPAALKPEEEAQLEELLGKESGESS